MEVGVFVVYVAGPGCGAALTACRLDAVEKRTVEVELKAAPEVELRMRRRK